MTDAVNARDDSGVWTVVVAAGGGSRFGGAKQYLDIAGRRVLDWSVAAARTVSSGVVVVVPERDLLEPVPGADVVVAGGSSRAESVRAGLTAVPHDATIIVVHDAARPAASADVFARVVDAVRSGARAVVPVVPVIDSVRTTSGEAIDRGSLVAVQTPQAFEASALRQAHAGGGEATDDASLVEALGVTIALVEGEVDNAKLTHPGDRAVLEFTLQERDA